MRLEKYHHFLSHFPIDKQNIFHLGTISERYFYLAEYQIHEFEREIEVVFHPNNKFTISPDRLYSFALGFYALVKVTLDASYRLSVYFAEKYTAEDLQKYREESSKKIEPIRVIANDIVKHPIDDGEKKEYFFEPGGSDSTGAITIYKWWVDPNKEGDLSIKIWPKRDLQTVYEYLEGLAMIYSTILAPRNAKEKD